MAPKKSTSYPLVQSKSCKSRGLSKPFSDLSQCFVCTERHFIRSAQDGKDQCRFAGCRVVDSADAPPRFTFPPEPKAQFRSVFNRKAAGPEDLDNIRLHMEACARMLLPFLEKETEHAKLPGAMFRPRELLTRVTCDGCSNELFTCSWYCGDCGRELCSACLEAPPSHSHHRSCSHLIPTTRFEPTRLAETVEHMRKICSPGSISTLPSLPPDTPAEEPRRSIYNHTLNDFKQLFGRGIPVVITDAGEKLQGYWHPQDFIERHGREKITLVDCETEAEKNSTVAEFFGSLLHAEKEGPIWKLKDWPPTGHLQTEFPYLWEAFKKGVPHDDVTSVDGIYNLAAHFPQNGKIPDLGPKMYVAFGSKQDNEHSGSTRIHVDLTDAVNVMPWAETDSDGSPGGAYWDIWPAAYLGLLQEFLMTDELIGHDSAVHGDPVHAQLYYLTPADKERFYQRHGVRPYTIYQRPGEAVFIPAGCAHQVSNKTAAIKIACDFISLGNLSVTAKLASEFRQHRLVTNSGTDVLQLYTTLAYAWDSLHDLYKNLSRERAASSSTSYFPAQSFGMPSSFLAMSPCQVPDNGDYMAVDSTQQYPEASTSTPAGEEISSTSSSVQVAISARDSYMPKSRADPAARSHVNPERKAKNLKTREKRRLAMKQGTYSIQSAHIKKEGHDYQCPLGCGHYSRTGLLDHLRDVHPGRLTVDPKTLAKLRKPTKYDFHAFWKEFWANTNIDAAEGELVVPCNSASCSFLKFSQSMHPTFHPKGPLVQSLAAYCTRDEDLFLIAMGTARIPDGSVHIDLWGAVASERPTVLSTARFYMRGHQRRRRPGPVAVLISVGLAVAAFYIYIGFSVRLLS